MGKSVDQNRRLSLKHTVTMGQENEEFLENDLPIMFPDTKANFSRRVNKCVTIVRKAYEKRKQSE